MNNKIEIKNNYVTLHFDEYPILFIGKNYKSDIIIGSFICEEDDQQTLKYFHSIVNTAIAIKFLKREMSYIEVLKAASTIYIVTKSDNDAILKIEEKEFLQLDKSFLPLNSAYCPSIENKTINKVKSSFEKSVITSYSVPEIMNYPLSAAETRNTYEIKA